MPDIIDDDKKAGNKKTRILWFIGLYLAGLVVTGAAVYLLRAIVGLGMK